METDLLNNSSTLQHGKLSTLEAIRATMGKKKKKKKKGKAKSKQSLKKLDKPINKSDLPNNLNTLQTSPSPSPIVDAQTPNIIIQTGENIEDNPDNINNIIRIKDKLTDKELRFINFYLTGEHNQESAMDLTGCLLSDSAKI